MALNVATLTLRPRRHWNPDSKTLLGPIRAVGDCAGEQASDVLVGDSLIFDTALKVTSGDLVLVEILIPLAHGFTLSYKQLEAIDGRWWLASFHGLGPLSTKRHRVLGRLVASIHFPRQWSLRIDDGALHQAAITPPDGYRGEMIRATAPALAALAKFGFDRHTVFREARQA
jgi:hypothetical protein